MRDRIEFRLDGLPSEEAIRNRSREICRQVGEGHRLIRTLGWNALREKAGERLRHELAKQDGLSWLARAWTKSRELKAAGVESLNSGDERRVALASHDIAQDLHPTVKLVCGALELELEFTLQLSAGIAWIDLIVRDGCLVALQAGRLTPSAALSFRGIEISQETGRPIDLLEPYPLPPPGLRIARPEDLGPARDG
ncbi:MAG TPA: hypothetical protein VJM15_10350 [Sphingomicrobium sp.]|nr:hypothetical protein [Sphingomicrobium sp.]